MIKKQKLEEIYNNTIPHSTFLDTNSILSCMYQSYMLGREEFETPFIKLNNHFEEFMELLSEKEKNNKSIQEMISEWKIKLEEKNKK